MIKFLRLLILLSFLQGCASITTAIFPERIGADFKPYVASFEKDFDLRVVQTIIQFGPITIRSESFASKEVNLIAQCKDRVVSIDHSYWQTIGEGARKVLIYHELGHCVLNMQHRPKGIMQPLNFDPGDRFDRLVNEMKLPDEKK